MSKSLRSRRPSTPLPLVATILATLAVPAITADVMAQEKSNPQSVDSACEAATDQHAGDGRTGPRVGIIVAPSPSGSPLVLRVRPGSPADQAGIRHGDYILSVDDQEIESVEQLRKSIEEKEATDKRKLTLWRSGEEKSYSLNLEGPERRKDSRAWLGAMIRSVGDSGVEIARIYLDGPANEAGLKPGDRIKEIDGEDVSSPNAVTGRIARLEPGSTVEIVVDRDGEEMAAQVEVGNLEDLHERLFGKRFRRNFDDFRPVFDPDFDGIPEGVFLFRVNPSDDNDMTVRELLREMRADMKAFRRDLQVFGDRDRDSSDKQSNESNKKSASSDKKSGSSDKKSGSSDKKSGSANKKSGSSGDER